jgi:hypothetical protein
LTRVSYKAAGVRVEVYREHLAIGGILPEMPLEATYTAAFRSMLAFWRDLLEGQPSQLS